MRYFKKEEMARCFRENGARCRGCPLKQRAEKLPDGVEENLEALFETVLEPARERLGAPVTVNSGFRCVKHNRDVGGVAASQHLRGEAADVCCSDNRRLARIIVEQGRFDQLIVYPTFIHVSYKRSGANRKQVLRKTAKGYERVDPSTL